MKILRAIIILIIILIISDQLFGRLLRKYYFSMKSGIDAKLTHIIEKNDADLLIFGSSSAYHNYNSILMESKLGIKSFNAGRDGTGLLFSYGLLKMILTRYTPQIVILDLHPASLSESYTDEARIGPLLPYYRDHPEIKELVLGRSKFEQVKLFSQIYPYNSLIWDIIRHQEIIERKEFIVSKGYFPLDGKIKAGLTIPQVGQMTIGEEKTKIFLDFIQLAKSYNIRMIVVIPPEYIPKYKYPLEYIKSLCDQNSIELLDLSNDTDFINSPELYYDFVHLNLDGSKIFSNKIVDFIKDNKEHSNIKKVIN